MATKLSGMNRETYIIPKNSVKTIDYKDVEPNYFHIQNLGGTPLYFSSHTIPTTRIYDVKIDGGSIATFTDPYPQYEVYIFNPSATDDINIIMTSFKAPFDPVVLAQANKQISIGGTVETDGVIKGFNTALPAGSNKIGKVDVASLPTIPAGSNKIGKVDGASLPTIPAGSNNIGIVSLKNNIESAITGIKTDSGNVSGKIDTNLSQILEKLGNLSFDIGAVTVDQVKIKNDKQLFYGSGETITPPDGRYISKIYKIDGASSDCLYAKSAHDGSYVINVPQAPQSKEYIFDSECAISEVSGNLNNTSNPIIVYGETTPYSVYEEKIFTLEVNTSGIVTGDFDLKNGDIIMPPESGSISGIRIETQSGYLQNSYGEITTETVVSGLDDTEVLDFIQLSTNDTYPTTLKIKRILKEV